MYHILVCDDDKAILDSVEIYLNLEGYHTCLLYTSRCV